MKSWVIFGMKIMMLLMALASHLSNMNHNLLLAAPKSNSHNQTIRGNSGGSINSQNCGFIGRTPSYTLALPERIDYMRMLVQANGGQPTLLIIGPKAEDSFCVLGDMNAGLNPEISGVWEAGTYKIYIGDRTGERHQFTLKISTEPY